MPDKNPRMSTASLVATFGGFLVIITSLLVTANNLWVSPWVAIAVGVVAGATLLLLGFRLENRSNPDDVRAGGFGPTRTNAWGVVVCLVFAAHLVIPVSILYAFVILQPAGDRWPIAMLRMVLASLFCTGLFWWFPFIRRMAPKWFRGKVSDQVLAIFPKAEPASEPRTGIAAARKNWDLAAICIFAGCIVSGVIDFNGPWVQIDAGSRRVRGLMRICAWCGQHPNTILLTSSVLGGAAFGLYIYRIQRAASNSAA